MEVRRKNGHIRFGEVHGVLNDARRPLRFPHNRLKVSEMRILHLSDFHLRGDGGAFVQGGGYP